MNDDDNLVDADLDALIAVVEHLNGIDPLELADTVVEQMIREQGDLDHVEMLVARHAVMTTYNAIVGGAAMASVVA